MFVQVVHVCVQSKQSMKYFFWSTFGMQRADLGYVILAISAYLDAFKKQKILEKSSCNDI